MADRGERGGWRDAELTEVAWEAGADDGEALARSASFHRHLSTAL